MEAVNDPVIAKNDEKVVSTHFIFAVLFILGLWGCLAIYNATAHTATPFYFAARQLIWLFVGMGGLYISSKIPFEFYKAFAIPIAAVTYLALLLVLVLGIKVNGMRGWFQLFNASVFLQPTEFAKAPFILLMSCLCQRIENKAKRFGALVALTIIWVLPIIMQPDFGMVFIFIAAFAIVYWIGGGNVLYLIWSFLAATPVFIYLFSRKAYVLTRILGFLHPERDPSGSGWHYFQFQYTLARGGLWGTNLGRSWWANSYLPLSHSDSSFAAMTEAIGFAGAFPVVTGFALLPLIAFHFAKTKEDSCSRIFIFAMGTLLAVQALVHISVNITLFPPTGLTLPIMSYGGSSLVSTFLSFGLILSAINNKVSNNE